MENMKLKVDHVDAVREKADLPTAQHYLKWSEWVKPMLTR